MGSQKIFHGCGGVFVGCGEEEIICRGIFTASNRFFSDRETLKWTHRFRLEQRWIEELRRLPDRRYDTANWRGEQRLRYLLRTEIPLTPGKRFYVSLWNEAVWNFLANILGNQFDQNRAFLGLGWKISEHLRVETGFLEQTLHKRGAGGKN